MSIKRVLGIVVVMAFLAFGPALASAQSGGEVSDDFIQAQRDALAAETEGKGYGPQAPRDITERDGLNDRIFSEAPDYEEMNLCNIHFHAGAEHRGGQFTTYAGNGDGEGYGSGYLYDGRLSSKESAPYGRTVGADGRGGLETGDTIEVHYVYTTAQATPGPTLGSCLSDAIGNPQLRVVAQVFVLVNDRRAADFVTLAEVGRHDGYFQAVNLPKAKGKRVEYTGSTTGPTYNDKGSPFQVSWSVRSKVIKLDIASVDAWFGNNVFAETKAHPVRNLVINPDLLSKIN